MHHFFIVIKHFINLFAVSENESFWFHLICLYASIFINAQMYPQGRMSHHFREMRVGDFLPVRGPKVRSVLYKVEGVKAFIVYIWLLSSDDLSIDCTLHCLSIS